MDSNNKNLLESKSKPPTILNEIYSQKDIISNVASLIFNEKQQILKFTGDFRNVYFIGCGSSYHAGMIAEFTFNKIFTDKISYGITGSEFFIYPEIFIKNNNEQDLFFLISRTGRTTELIYSANEIKKRKGKIISLVTFPKCPLLNNSDFKIILDKAQEKSITATRSVTSTTAALIEIIYFLSRKEYFVERLLEQNEKFFANLDEYSGLLSLIINKEDLNNFVFLGSGPFYGVAREAELKVKEMSISNTTSSQPLEFRHGHKAIINHNTLAIIFVLNSSLKYEINAINDLKRLGAKVIIIHDSKKRLELDYKCDLEININSELDEDHKPIFYQVFGQLIGYHNALKKGFDPSNPENLDYFVTF